MPIFRRKNFIHTASGIFALCKRLQNPTNIKFNKEEMQLLKYGFNYSIERPASSYTANLIAETERAIRLLDTKMQNTFRTMATKKLKQIINSTN